MEGIGLVVVLGVAWVLGYWAAHIRLTTERIRVLKLMKEARHLLDIAKALALFDKLKPTDRSKGDGTTGHPGP
jgi:hypothetical protein